MHRIIRMASLTLLDSGKTLVTTVGIRDESRFVSFLGVALTILRELPRRAEAVCLIQGRLRQI